MVLNFCKELVYHRLEVCISPESDVAIDGWLGAVIRNNFLFAAAEVKAGKEMSLLELIDRLPLRDDHPLYGELLGGFPKGYSLSVVSPGDVYASRLFFHKGEKVVFSLVLFGKCVSWYKDFIVAVRMMCKQGMGSPRVPWLLHEIYETDGQGRSQQVAVGYSDKVAPLRFPVRLMDFEEERFGCREKQVRLDFISPVQLTLPAVKKNTTGSYQDKMNGFPSFYQLVRSAVFRCVKLTALYACPLEKEAYLQANEEIEDYIEQAASAWLEMAGLRRVSMRGPKRDDGRLPIILSGYMGKLVFSGDFNVYTPFLAFMQAAGIGNDTVYGLGAYRIEVLKMSKPKENEQHR